MPEGDTVHRWAERLRTALCGHALTRVEIRRDTRGLRPPAPGTHVTEVEARGKHLLVHFDDGATLHTHMMLDGVWHVYRPRARWRRAAYRARVVLRSTTAPLRSASTRPSWSCAAKVAPVLRPAQPSRSTASARICAATRPMSTPCSTASPRSRPRRRSARRCSTSASRPASATSSSRRSAGRGACIPRRRSARSTRDVRRALYETAHAQLRANLGSGRRVTYRGGLAVYGKQRRPCPRCRTPIQRAWTGSDPRVTYWCSRCRARAGYIVTSAPNGASTSRSRPVSFAQ